MDTVAACLEAREGVPDVELPGTDAAVDSLKTITSFSLKTVHIRLSNALVSTTSPLPGLSVMVPLTTL